jgi:hypothetical protein
MYGKQVRDDTIKGLSKDFKMNITNNEEKALRELLYDDSIVIRDRENVLQYNTKKQNNHVPLVITYSKALPKYP